MLWRSPWSDHYGCARQINGILYIITLARLDRGRKILKYVMVESVSLFKTKQMYTLDFDWAGSTCVVKLNEVGTLGSHHANRGGIKKFN